MGCFVSYGGADRRRSGCGSKFGDTACEREGAVSPGGMELRSGRTTADNLGARKKDVELREAAELRKQLEEEARKTQSTRERLEKELMYLKETKKRLDEETESVNRARHSWDLATRTVTSRMASNLGTPSNIRGEYDFLSRGRGDRWSERPVAGFLSGYVESPVNVTPTTCRPLSSTGIPELTLIRSTGSSVAGLAVESVGRATDSGMGTSVQLLSGGLLSGRATGSSDCEQLYYLRHLCEGAEGGRQR